jgi:hypothetical protein
VRRWVGGHGRLALIMAGVVGSLALPGWLELAQAWWQGDLWLLDRWVPCLLLGGTIYFGLALYGWQLPDPSSAWFIAVAALAGAAAVAMVLAFSLFAPLDDPLVTWGGLGEGILSGAVPAWCLLGWLALTALSLAFGWLSWR